MTAGIYVKQGGVLVPAATVPGPIGPTGPQGPTGPAGQGVPTGGTAGQALVKISGTNYNTQWAAVNGLVGSGVGFGIPGREIYDRSDTALATNQRRYLYFQVDKPATITAMSNDLFNTNGTGTLRTAIYKATDRFSVGALQAALPDLAYSANGNFVTTVTGVTLPAGGYYLVTHLSFGTATLTSTRARLVRNQWFNDSGIQTRPEIATETVAWPGSWPSSLAPAVSSVNLIGGSELTIVTLKWTV